MTPEDAPAPSRRALRSQASASAASGLAAPSVVMMPEGHDPAAPPSPEPSRAKRTKTPRAPKTAAPPPRPRTAAPRPRPRSPKKTAVAPAALGWVDPAAVGARTRGASLDTSFHPYILVEPDLLARAPRRSPWRPGVIVPTTIIALLFAVYAGTTLFWPLHAIAPQITAVHVDPIPAPAAAPAWPAQGTAAIEVVGMGSVSPAIQTDAIASITKVVTALLVLEEMPLALGEQGPEFRFTAADSARYWDYLRNDESALDVPVGGVLTEYQLLQGMLIGSANNYADRLAGNLWPTDRVFADAARQWLTAHGVPGLTIVDPSGIEYGNTATAAALLPLAERALAHPVIAEIVATRSVELPGAGLVTNTNDLLADPGVVGIKTGSLDTFNLLSAKNVTIGDTTVRLYAAVLGQPDDEARDAASRALYAELEKELQLRPSVTAGTLAGVVETRWGAKVDVVTGQDASVILWNGGAGAVTAHYALGDERSARAEVGTLSVRGPLDGVTVPLRLAEDVPGPSPWWRLTHPLDLFGLN